MPPNTQRQVTSIPGSDSQVAARIGHSRRDVLKIAGGTVAGAAIAGAAVAVEIANRRESTAESMIIRPGMPELVAAVDSLALSQQEATLDSHLQPGVTYRLRALINGGASMTDNAAVIRLVDAGGGDGLASSSDIGPHIKMRTGNGLMRTDRLFTVEKPVSRSALRSSADPSLGPLFLATMTIERADLTGRPVDIFFSFDVEAAMTRAKANPIDTLVWGKIDGGEYGLRRICGVLEQYKIKANFMIDFGSCLREGERQLRDIIDFLASRGHELHMHLHPSDLSSRWGIKDDDSLVLSKSSYDMERRMLDYTARVYQQYVGKDPRVFRSGGYQLNQDVVLAAGSVGIKMITNVRDDMVGDPAVSGDVIGWREPFRWENGVLEMPVDVSSQEESPWSSFAERYDAAIRRKRSERTFNIVMHSFSMLNINSAGIYDKYAPDQEERIHQMCQHAVANGTTRGYGEYLDLQRPARPRTPLSYVKGTVYSTAAASSPIHVTSAKASTGLVVCTVCETPVGRAALLNSEVCPSCGTYARHRQLKDAFGAFGNLLDGRKVLAYDAKRLRICGFLSGASDVKELDSPKALDSVGTSSAEAVVALHLITSISDASPTTASIAKVIQPGGLFVSTAPYHTDDNKPHGSNTMALKDYVDALAASFDVLLVPGYDPMTGLAARVFFAYRRG